MRFWDASAIVPLVAEERVSAQTLDLYRDDPEILVWMLTITEVMSALCRKLRAGALTRDQFRAMRSDVVDLSMDWSEVTAAEAVRRRANRLLEVHDLRAADALQLASALIATADEPQGFPFVTFDSTLGIAAEKEGFTVLPG